MTALAGIALSQWRAEGRDFNFQWHRIRYWKAGEGEPLLLIHGFPTAAWDWHYLWRPLAERYRVIACDMLGFGDSAKPRGHRYSLLEQADLQQHLLAHLGVDGPVHLLAHDYGDSVAQELLARHCEGRGPIASCVFLNGGLFPETHHPVRVQKLLLGPLGPIVARMFNRDRLAQGLTRVFGPETPPGEREIDAFWSLLSAHDGPAVMHRLIRYIPERRQQRERWLAAMRRAAVPLRVIDGALDPVSGAHMIRRYEALIERPDCVLLEGIGHYPQIEAPDAVLEHYLAFRAALSSAAASIAS